MRGICVCRTVKLTDRRRKETNMRTGEIVDNKMDAQTEAAVDGSVQRDCSTDAELVDRMNKAEDCILYLRIQRLLTDGETDRIRRKISQRLIDASKIRRASP